MCLLVLARTRELAGQYFEYSDEASHNLSQSSCLHEGNLQFNIQRKLKLAISYLKTDRMWPVIIVIQLKIQLQLKLALLNYYYLILIIELRLKCQLAFEFKLARWLSTPY